ncbi:MAG: Unknown protein [uncultured Sulfurovum sp.]|uniref:Inner membrane protein n=1 Tax=uncultured Sulfurovum sp. TaxID=269237 RepID=A0A6S6TSR2_9BACT|nr:MAG: Unknown protein [uncultured Sulfurovum sp.]
MEFSATELLPYSISFLIFLMFSLLEIMVLILGWGIFDFLDDMFPSHQGDVDLDAQSSLGSFFAYMNPEKVPFSMVLLSLFFIFAFTGTLIQNIFGSMSLSISLPIATILTFILLRHTTTLIAKVLPKETSEVVSTDSFIGKKAFILDPSTKRDLPARAKVKDVYGEIHHIRVEPLNDEDIFHEGENVLIMEKKGLIFFVEKTLEF